MSDDDKPRLLRIERDGPYFAVTFNLYCIDPRVTGEIVVRIHPEIREEHLLEVARDHLRRVLKTTVDGTADWKLSQPRQGEVEDAGAPQTDPGPAGGRRRPDKPDDTGTGWAG